jgi:hypothetical protein
MGLLRKYGVAFGVGVLGVLVTLALAHAYVDHKNLHTLMAWAVKQSVKTTADIAK